ncbi:hypothetical protein L7F22_027009 [Adiantum nelumboides]|nr:hypothetical protein [Adiantum nelumboides]
MLNETQSELSLLYLIDIPTWFRLYSLAQENPRNAVQRLRELAANLKTIADDDEREQKEWTQQSPNVMRRFMEGHRKKLRNDPIVRQRKRHLLNGFDEVFLSPQLESTSSLIPMDLDEEDQALATKRFSNINPSLNLSKKPFDTYTDPFIPGW